MARTKLTPYEKMIKRLEKKFKLQVVDSEHIESDNYEIWFKGKDYPVVCHL